MKYRIQTRYKADFAHDLSFYQTLYLISEAAYEQPEAIIRYSIEPNDTVYCLLNEKDETEGILFTNWADQSLLLTDNQQIKCIYIGWGVVRPVSQGKGIFRQMLEFLRAEVFSYFQMDRKPLCLYARTASPQVYRRLKRVFANLQPESDGQFSEDVLPIVTMLRSSWSQPVKDEHPFALYKAARYHYSSTHAAIIEQDSRQRPVVLFENLSINERKGDRLLMLTLIA